ncbi:SAF domain-containing protein [Nocardia sp. NPDC051030]|uniref:SAF domain-containing protein n=1 Tax=Nocardia sp. NPDC051030 TaxID=3155162 RepID=UPI003431E9AB
MSDSKLTPLPRRFSNSARASTNGSAHPPQAVGDPDPVHTPVRARRRPVILGLGIAAVSVSILGAVGVVNGLRDTQEVLVLTKDVSQGEMIATDDVKAVRINSDAGLDVVLAASLDQVLGKTVTSNQTAGTMLNPRLLVTAVVPPKGTSLVGITVTGDKIPGEPLAVGDMVRLVDTPRDQEGSPATAPVTSNAQVYAIHRRDEAGQSQVTIDVLVPEAEANWVAARAATHRVAVILDTRER